MKRSMMTLFLSAIVTVGIAATPVNLNENSTPIKEVVAVNSFCKMIQQGDYLAVERMIQKGEDVNKKSTGLTPLMFAARHNRPEIAQLLIDNGAKLYTTSDKGDMTALDFAQRSKADETASVIENAIEQKKGKKKKKKKKNQ